MLLCMYFLVSCRKKETPVVVSDEYVSIKITDKANNIQEIRYETAVVSLQDLSTTSLPDLVGISIVGTDDKFSTAISFIRNKRLPFEYYQAGAPGFSIFSLGEYGVNTYSKIEALLYSVPSSPINRGRERLIITKDDVNTLEGSFKIGLIDPKLTITDTLRMEGSFSVAKKGRF